MRILFVDDDTHLLRGLRRMLHRQGRWHMDFEDSAESAVARMGAEPIDLLLTDMRMPGLSGMELLRQAQARFPSVFRGVLSGQVERDLVLQAMPLAHHFLRKPCAPIKIHGLVERVERLHRLVPDVASRATVGAVVQLPVRTTILKLLELELGKEEPALDKVAALTAQDVAISARMLHVADTPFFSPPPRFLDVAEAVGFLGTSSVRFLVCEGDLFRPSDDPELEALLRHSLLVARLMEKLLPTEPLAFTTGLLHDIGLLLDAPARLSRRALGAYLLGLWGAPTAMMNAVAGQRDNEALDSRRLDLVTGLEMACALVDELDGRGALNTQDLPVEVDLDQWRAIARQLAELSITSTVR